MRSRRLFKLFMFLVLPITYNLSPITCSYAQETLTITTYYPSPFGNYRELRAQRMAVGTNWVNPVNFPWDAGGGCAANEICNAAMVVEGNVGIGTRNPQAELEIRATDGISAIRLLEQGAGMSPADFEIRAVQVVGLDRLDFYTSSGPTTIMALQKDGNVGIGTTVPGAKLHLSSLASTNDGIILDNPDWGPSKARIFFREGGSSTYGGIVGYDAGADVLYLNGLENTVEKQGIAIARATGNVGIGTVSPSASAPTGKLQIVDNGANIYMGHGIFGATDEGLYASGSAGASIVMSGYNTVNNCPVGIAMLNNGTMKAAVWYASVADRLMLSTYNNTTTVTIAPQPSGWAVNIKPNGSVGIGTDSPGVYRLYVNGNMYVSGDITTDAATYPDYVFDYKHKKLTLTELKNFIGVNKHLPGLPTAKEAKEKGVKIFEQNGLILEKLEEAYLYILELQDRIEKLENSK